MLLATPPSPETAGPLKVQDSELQEVNIIDSGYFFCRQLVFEVEKLRRKGERKVPLENMSRGGKSLTVCLQTGLFYYQFLLCD